MLMNHYYECRVQLQNTIINRKKKKRLGILQPDSMKQIISQHNTGMIHPPRNQSYRRHMSLSKRGENNSHWIDGRSSISDRLRRIVDYDIWRFQVYEKDDYKCKECNSSDGITAHHIIPFKEILERNNIRTIADAEKCEELWDINNGETLCRKCHRKPNRHSRGKYI